MGDEGVSMRALAEYLVGGLLFQEFPSQHHRGFVVTEFDESVDTRSELVARPASHGDFDMPVFRGSRVFTFTGAAFALSAWELQQMEQDFYGVLADGSAGNLLIQRPAGSQRSLVRLSGVPKFTPVGERDADFQISFRAADPRKFGDLREFSGSSVQVHHYGNFPASPVVEVVGPRTGPYTITGPGGRQFVVNQSLSAGQTHRIDFRSGRLYRNGSLQVGQTGRSDTWAVPAGQRITMGISSGSMTVKLADTYM